MSFTKVTVIGLGYIGLPTATVLASQKIEVHGVDINPDTVEVINQGLIHIVEPDLDSAVHLAVQSGYLRASLSPAESDAFLIAVPTPFKGGFQPDLSFVEAACRSIAPFLKAGDLIVLESTSPVGTTERVSEWLSEVRGDLTFPHQLGDRSDIRIAYCPERVLPGRVLVELVENDRVIGGLSPKCSARAVELYKSFVRGQCIVTSARTAELCKLAENSYRDVNIAFANELAAVCETQGIDPWELVGLANRHPRVNILQPGPGVGGHCIAIDPWFIVDTAPDEARLIRQARLINDERPMRVAEQIGARLDEWARSSAGVRPKVACLGLSYKANIDDVRSSPAMQVANLLAVVCPDRLRVVEPHLAVRPQELSSGVPMVTLAEACAWADVVVLLVPHSVFADVPGGVPDTTLLIDVCGAWRGASKTAAAQGV